MCRLVSTALLTGTCVTCTSQVEDSTVVGRYRGAVGFLVSLGSNLQMYLDNLASSFPNQKSLDVDQLNAFIEVQPPGGTHWVQDA